MSLINVDGQIDQNAAAQLATQLAQIIQAAPNTSERLILFVISLLSSVFRLRLRTKITTTTTMKIV